MIPENPVRIRFLPAAAVALSASAAGFALVITLWMPTPENMGYDYGRTLEPLPGAPLLDGTSGGQRGACAAKAVLTYNQGDDQDDFMRGCLDGARRA